MCRWCSLLLVCALMGLLKKTEQVVEAVQLSCVAGKVTALLVALMHDLKRTI